MSFLADDDEGVTIRPHLRKVRGGGRSGGRRGSGLSGSLLNKWNFAEGSRAAVFKKIASGGTHTRHQMRRQMDYINTKAQYTFGFSDALTDERRQPEASLEAIADSWEASWQGTPKNGHTSHLLISFPPDTAPRDAAAIAEEMSSVIRMGLIVRRKQNSDRTIINTDVKPMTTVSKKKAFLLLSG